MAVEIISLKIRNYLETLNNKAIQQITKQYFLPRERIIMQMFSVVEMVQN